MNCFELLRGPTRFGGHALNGWLCSLASVFLMLTLFIDFKCAIGQTRVEFGGVTSVPKVEKIDAVRATQVVQEAVPLDRALYYLPIEVDRRLCRLKGEYRPEPYSYAFAPEDQEAWLKLLLDEEADDIARMCAAVFLYDQSMDARGFLSDKLESPDLDIQLNAAMALVVVYYQSQDKGVLDELSTLMNKLFVESDWKSFETMGLNEGKKGHYFLRKVAGLLAHEQVDSQLPALVEIIEREAAERKFAISVVRSHESEEACELTIDLMKSGKYGSASMAMALARHGYTKAIPEITSLLGTDLQTNSMINNWANIIGQEQSMVLSALLKLNAKTAIPQIQQFIDSGKFVEQIPQAERLIIHLSSDDPVIALLTKLDPADRTRRTATVIDELRTYSDPRCLKGFGELVQTSDSFWTRSVALHAISEIPGDDALSLLADLLKVSHPENLETNEPPKDRAPDELGEILRRETLSLLQQRTGHNIGRDTAKWKAWIATNPGK